MNTVLVTPSISYIDVLDNEGGFVTLETSSVETVELSNNGGFVTIEIPSVETVELITAGPQGPPGINIPVTTDSPVTGSLVYYDQGYQVFRVDSDHTISTLTDGGNF